MLFLCVTLSWGLYSVFFLISFSWTSCCLLQFFSYPLVLIPLLHHLQFHCVSVPLPSDHWTLTHGWRSTILLLAWWHLSYAALPQCTPSVTLTWWTSIWAITAPTQPLHGPSTKITAIAIGAVKSHTILHIMYPYPHNDRMCPINSTCNLLLGAIGKCHAVLSIAMHDLSCNRDYCAVDPEAYPLCMVAAW